MSQPPAQSSESTPPADEWARAEASLASYQGRLGLEDHEAVQLRQSCRRPEQLQLMLRLLAAPTRSAPDSRGNFRYFLHEVRDSSFTVSEWIEALEVFYTWLESEQRKASFEDAIGYLHCCAEATEQQPGWSSLRACTQGMLDDFGYRGSGP